MVTLHILTLESDWTIHGLKRELRLTDEQHNATVKDSDLPELEKVSVKTRCY